jgi:hypothetical protein
LAGRTQHAPETRLHFLTLSTTNPQMAAAFAAAISFSIIEDVNPSPII